MKIRKNADQKNFIVDREYYTDRELFELFEVGLAAIFTDTLDRKKVESVWDIEREDEVRIFTCDCAEVKVSYSTEYGCYETIAVTKSGLKVHITL